MVDHPSLFDAPRAGDCRATDPLPSKRAAGANLTARQSQKKSILQRMLDGPVTSHDVAGLTGGQNNRASKRLGELRDDHLIVECGYKWPSERRSGIPLTIYRLTDEGHRTVQVMFGGGAS